MSHNITLKVFQIFGLLPKRFLKIDSTLEDIFSRFHFVAVWKLQTYKDSLY